MQYNLKPSQFYWVPCMSYWRHHSINLMECYIQQTEFHDLCLAIHRFHVTAIKLLNNWLMRLTLASRSPSLARRSVSCWRRRLLSSLAWTVSIFWRVAPVRNSWIWSTVTDKWCTYIFKHNLKNVVNEGCLYTEITSLFIFVMKETFNYLN